MVLSARPRTGGRSGTGRNIWNSPAFALVGVGGSLAATIVLMTLLGRWLDGQFGTEPVLTLVGLVLGLAAGLYGAYTQLQDVLRRLREQSRRGE